MKEEYRPSEEILDKYSDVLINFALGKGKGIKKGDVVFLQVSECSKPMLLSLRRAVLKAGGNPLIKYIPCEITKEFYELADKDQTDFFPDKYMKGIVDQIDHSIFILGNTNPHELNGIDPKRIMGRSMAFKPYKNWREEKENQGKFCWTIALYGTKEMADEAGLSLGEYWDQIIKACYLDEKDPVKKWREIKKETGRLRSKLNSLEIEKVHIKSENTDLTVGLGKGREWLGGDGCNIPSFEVFISPDWRLTSGKAYLTEPLYRYGNMVKGIRLEFEDGKVTKVSADEGEKVIKEMINTKNANKIGEFSLTDSRMSRITKFMAETLFDENVGGKNGNFHIAFGNAYKDSYPGDSAKVSKEEWKKMGYNESVIHADVISTENRVVTATLKDGSEKVIYKDGKFTV